jgi:iron complex transport system substrate-binding protein
VSIRTTRSAAVALTLGAALVLSACASSAPAGEEPAESADATTVTITDNHGEVEVPVNPETVVALDNTIFDTLDEWDVELAAVPKDVMGSVWPDYIDDPEVANVGNHREPNLEVIVAEQPDLIIGGYRFGDYYDQIKQQNPDAVVIEISPRDDEDEFDELKRQTEILGQIFDHEDEATELNEGLDEAIAGAKEAYNGTDTVMAVNTSAGQIGYLAPVVGRGLGPVFPALGWKPALEVEGATDDHQGDDISVEAIADSNPDWILAMDRDAALTLEDGYQPAAEVLEESEALKNVSAITAGNVVYMPEDTYTNEGIETYTEFLTSFADALEK